MPKKPARSRPARRKSTRRSSSRWRWLIKPGLVALALMAFVSVYLDAVIRAKFEGKKWALPAKVYARPLELYEGLDVPADELASLLEELGYRRADAAPRRGQYRRSASQFVIGTRGFRFWDGDEPSRTVQVDISQSRIVHLRETKGGELALLRLEPLQIGSIFPREHEDRVLLQLEEVPKAITTTLIAVEDRYFPDHFGISLRGIARAIVTNIAAGRTVQGGSTITQQLVKNFYLTSERSLWRKIMEAWMAVLLEAHYSKEQILETYLNEVYLGQDGNRAIHGFGLASQHYFRQPLDELALHQVALLVGIVKGPAYYNPWRHPERARARRDTVLDILQEREVITPEMAGKAKKMSLGVADNGSYRSGAYPAFLDLVRRQLKRDYKEEDLASEGLQVFTTVDVRVQRAAERSLAEGIADLEKRYSKLKQGDLQGAVVVTSPASGEVLAVVGSRSPKYAGYNRAVESHRPIGSLIKPWLYLAAIESRQYTLASLVSDGVVSIKSGGKQWRPDNYDGKDHGTVTVYEALAHSYNRVAARVGLAIGVPNVLQTLHRAGVEGEFQPLPSVLLGSVELSPLDMAVAYQALAANGFVMPPRAIREVFTAEGRQLSRYPLDMEQRFSAAYVQIIQTAMRGVMTEGTATSIRNYLPSTMTVAGKTGTTNDSRDSWFAGFSGNHNAVVWLGRDDNGKMPLTGATGALQVWGRLMRDLPNAPLPEPSDEQLVFHWIDRYSGQRVNRACGARTLYLPFLSGTEPKTETPCGQTDALLDWMNRNLFGH